MKNLRLNDIKKIHQCISEYVNKSSMKRACFLTKEQYEILLSCLEYLISEAEKNETN